MLLFLLSMLVHAGVLHANTEKAIFLAPPSLLVPVEHPTLEELQLQSLTPQHWSVRTHVRAEFPSNASKHGPASWYLLQDLHEGQRYEVRICWAAIQPTSFRLDTFEVPTVLETPELITSLAEYSETRRQALPEKQQTPSRTEEASSTLFLRVLAAADYYTMNKTLMENVPPVYVDILLDPFVYNVFPRSLLPTAAYITLVAIASWYLANYISEWMNNLSEATPEKKKES